MGSTGSVTRILTASCYPDGQRIDLYYWHSFKGLVITDLALTTIWLLAHAVDPAREQAVRAALRGQGVDRVRHDFQMLAESPDQVVELAATMGAILESVLAQHFPQL